MAVGEPRCPHCGNSMVGPAGPHPYPTVVAAPVARPPVKCPVCAGRGTVAHSFYEKDTPGVTSVSPNVPVQCRSCNGRGIV